MTVNEKDVRHVANLAQFNLTEGELQVLVSDFNRILPYFAKLNQVDTTGVPPTAHLRKVKNRFREDAVKPSLTREEALKNASAMKDGCFKVPQIID